MADPSGSSSTGNRWAELNDINFTDLIRGWEVRTSFPDDELLSKPGVLLQALEPESVAKLGRSCLPMMISGFTKQGIAAIFLLSYNLQYQTEQGNWEPVFYDESVENHPEDKSYDTFSDSRPINYGVYKEISPSGNVKLEAVFYSYIATSLLRLFSKPFDNYIRSWNQIVNGFSRFYKVNPPLKLSPPSGDSIKELAIFWGGCNPVYKVSLFKLLYASGGAYEKGLGLKKFLYDNYLANTGLHTVDVFFKLAKVLNCSPEKLLTFIDRLMFSRAKKCLREMIVLMSSDEDDHKRKLWRYGRVFDEKFMADMATKQCPMLVYALATALKEEAPGENDGLLNIVQLKNLSEVAKISMAKFGKDVVKAVRSESSAVSGRTRPRMM